MRVVRPCVFRLVEDTVQGDRNEMLCFGNTSSTRRGSVSTTVLVLGRSPVPKVSHRNVDEDRCR